MKNFVRIVGSIAIAVVAGSVLAASTWTAVSSTPGYVRGVKAVNTTASGTDPAPVTSTVSTDGLNLMGLGGLAVLVETTTGGAMTAGGKLLGYVWNPATGKWHAFPDLDLTVSAVPAQAFPGLAVAADYGRIAWSPSGLGTTTNVYVYGTSRLLMPR